MVSSRFMARHVLVTYAGQLLTYGQGIILLPIIIRMAGAESYGAYILLMSLVSFLFGISSLGVGYRFKRKFSGIEDRESRRSLFMPQFVFQAIVLAILATAFVFAAPLINAELFDGKVTVSAWIGPVWLMGFFLYSQVADYFRYSLRFWYFNCIVTVFPYLFVGGVVATAALWNHLNVETLFAINTAAYGIACLPLLIKVLREIGISMPRLVWADLVSDIRLGFPLTLEYVIDFLLSFAGRYIITMMLSVTAVAHFQPAYAIGSLLLFFPKGAAVVLPASLSRLLDSGHAEQARMMIDGFVRLFLLLAIPFCVGALMMGPGIITLLAGPEIAQAGMWVTPLIAIATVFYGLTLVASQIAFVLGATRSLLTANALAAAVTIILNFAGLALFPYLEVPAVVSLIAYATAFFWIMHVIGDSWPIHFPWTDMAKGLIAAMIMGATLWLLGWHTEVAGYEASHQGAGALILGIGVALTVYALILIVLGGLTKADLQFARNLFSRKSPA